MTDSRTIRQDAISRRGVLAGAGALTELTALAGAGALAGARRLNVAGAPATPDPAGTPAATPGATPAAAGPTILVRVEYVGGFVTPESALTRTPVYQLTDDGVEVAQGVQILIYPPPALPALSAATLTEAGIDAVLSAARTAGLAGEDARYVNEVVTDLPSHVITVTVDGRTTVTTTYGLDQLDPTVTGDLAAARDRIAVFLATVTNPPSLRPNGQLAAPESGYVFERLQFSAIPVAVFPAAANVDPLAVQDDSARAVTWPLATRIAALGIPLEEAVGGEGYAGIFPGARVATISGTDLAAVLPHAEGANQLTRWVSDGADWIVLLRPLLPGEVGDLARPAADPATV